jgi:hypothetical protein
MEQLRPDKAYCSMVTSSFSGKKCQIIGISSPKLTLFRAGITANLVCLMKLVPSRFLVGFQQISNQSIIGGPHSTSFFCAIRKPL